jgi:hypothetical protein
MKLLSLFSAVLVGALVVVSGCTKRQPAAPLFEGKDVVMTQVATGAKTKAGQTVDAYEFVNAKAKFSTILVVVGGGKLTNDEKNGWMLDEQLFALDLGVMRNIVVVAKKGQFAPGWMENVKVADAKAKLAAGGTIDLAIDEALKNVPSVQVAP